MSRKTCSKKTKFFYVIRFPDGQYFTGTTGYTRRRTTFKKARVYNQKNHACLSIKELGLEDAEIIELSVEEPSHEKEETSQEESNRALP